MTRSQAALIIVWLAFVPGALLFSGNAGAIPGAPGQLSVNAEPAADFQPTGEQATSDEPPAVQLVDGEPADTQELPDLVNLPANPIDRQQAFSIQFGRRLAVDSGILGNTDGIRVDYRLNSSLTLRGIAGYPVVSSKDEFNTARQLLGFSADTGTFANAWNLNAYLIDEQDNAQLDNRVIGGTLRYQRTKRSLLLFLDYDANQDMLNAITASGALILPGRTTLSATFDMRNNAMHKRQKKHLQHSMASIDGWNWIIPDDRVKHYASQRTRKVTTRGLSLSHAFSQRFKLSGDVAMLDISNNSLSGDATPPEVLPSEYFYHLKLTGKDLLISGNSNKLDIRHRVTGSSRISTASIDTRYVINRLWNFSPRLRTELRDSVTDKSAEWVTSPTVKIEYRWKKAYGFQFEAGGKWSNQAISSADTSRSTYLLNLGYQANF
jgi:hypothetical protein